MKNKRKNWKRIWINRNIDNLQNQLKSGNIINVFKDYGYPTPTRSDLIAKIENKKNELKNIWKK